jgi:arylsulfatase
VSLFADGALVGQGHLERTVPLVFSADETCDVGRDTGSPVSTGHTSEESAFTGTIAWVQLDVDDAAEDADHMISPEERLRLAFARW